MTENINDEIAKMNLKKRQTSNDNHDEVNYLIKCGSRIQSMGSLVI
jgi:hypothetical protein